MRLAVLALAAALGGCTTTGSMQPTNDPDALVWVRQDGRSVQRDASLRVQAQGHLVICENQGRQAAMMAPGYVAFGTGAIIGAAIGRAIAQQGLYDSQMQSCMAQHGYLRMTRREADAHARAMSVRR